MHKTFHFAIPLTALCIAAFFAASPSALAQDAEPLNEAKLIAVLESDAGWLPYFLERLDTMKNRHGWDHYGMLKELPSHYWHQNMLATFEEDTYGVSQRHRVGVDNLMWATDYPHPDSTWPHSQKVLQTHFADVPLEEAQAMIGGTAARLYRL